jgi:excisionase family DNA binding protein
LNTDPLGRVITTASSTDAGEHPTAHLRELLGSFAATCLDLMALGALACDAPVAVVGVPAPSGRWSTLSYGSDAYRGSVADWLLQRLMCAGGPFDATRLLATSGNCVRWAYGGSLADAHDRRLGAVLLLDRRERAVTNREEEAMRAMTRQISAALSSARDLAAHPRLRDEAHQGRAPAVAGGHVDSLELNGGERADLLRSADVAGLFHVTVRTVANWATSGRLPSVRTVGGHRRFPVDGVASLLGACTAGKNSELTSTHRSP